MRLAHCLGLFPQTPPNEKRGDEPCLPPPFFLTHPFSTSSSLFEGCGQAFGVTEFRDITPPLWVPFLFFSPLMTSRLDHVPPQVWYETPTSPPYSRLSHRPFFFPFAAASAVLVNFGARPPRAVALSWLKEGICLKTSDFFSFFRMDSPLSRHL